MNCWHICAHYYMEHGDWLFCYFIIIHVAFSTLNLSNIEECPRNKINNQKQQQKKWRENVVHSQLFSLSIYDCFHGLIDWQHETYIFSVSNNSIPLALNWFHASQYKHFIYYFFIFLFHDFRFIFWRPFKKDKKSFEKPMRHILCCLVGSTQLMLVFIYILCCVM